MPSVHTKIMGILNVTPDSAYSGSRFYALDSAIAQGILLAQQGADILDIGGESTRPGATPVTLDEELNRVIPVITQLKTKISIPISIDTTKPEVAEHAIAAGATLINDVSGFRDPLMIKLAAQTNSDICVMHMQGNPETMQNMPSYPRGIITELLNWFEQKIEILLRHGISKNKIILDPGIGFGKTVADNLEILHNLPQFKELGFPVLLGLSRKSFMGKILGVSNNELLSATLAMNTIAIWSGVDYIRVHDVKEHKEASTVLTQLLNIASKAT